MSALLSQATRWAEITEEARVILEKDDFMEPLLSNFILSHESFSDAIIAMLSNQFSGVVDQSRWLSLFSSTIGIEYELGQGTLDEIGFLDLAAIKDRDPAADNLVNPFMFFKGFKAIQAHRIAHVLWKLGRREAACAVQSRCSDLFGVDIHPAAVLGSGLMIDHGTGVVIGETAVVGRNCTFLHGVTLGSTGKDSGDRHPKLGNSILVGCNVTILGNITLGDSCKIGSGSIVMKSLPCGVTAVGNPARIVGTSKCPCAASGMDMSLQHVETKDGDLFSKTYSLWADGSSAFDEADQESRGKLNIDGVVCAYTLRFSQRPDYNALVNAYAKYDKDRDGFLCREEFEKLIAELRQPIFLGEAI